MDPDVALETLVTEARRLLARGVEPDVVEFAQHVLKMDAWLRAGGFLPKPWDKRFRAGSRV